MITYSGVGPKPETFPRQPAKKHHSPSGRMTALALAPDGRRLYAGSFAGLWRSDDGGASWFQLTWPQPPIGIAQADIPGALYAPHVYDVATSPADTEVVLASALDSQFVDGRDGVYRSADGGRTWTLVLESTSTPTSPFNVVFAPDDPQLVYAAGTKGDLRDGPTSGVVGISKDGGQSWSVTVLGSTLWHIAAGPLEADGKRRVYAAGDGRIWYSSDGGQRWDVDGGVATIRSSRKQVDAFQKNCNPQAGVGGFAGATAYAVGSAPQILAVEPGDPSKVYLATTGAANGPAYYSEVDGTRLPDGVLVNSDCRYLAGEASLWRGDFADFGVAKSARWTLLPGPPVYRGVSTPSGNCYVATKPTSTGFLVFFSDTSHVHVSAGVPAENESWHRLDGMDASEAKRRGIDENRLFVHADPHAIAFTPDFEITLKPPSGVQDPYDRNSELDEHVAGRLWMANDGGVYWCDDGGRAEASWQMPSGLETLDPINVAGLFGFGSAPALYFGCGDNNDFFTRDGGDHWGDPGSECGDCDAWFADRSQADRVLQFLPRRGIGAIVIIESDGSHYPDARNDNKTVVPSPKRVNPRNPATLQPYAQSDVYLLGYRPLIQTLASEAPPPDGDLVIVEQALDRVAKVLRTTSISSIKTLDDWHDPAKAQQVGPELPPGAIIVQASGGHASPTYYVGDGRIAEGGSIWKLSADATAWNQIAPRSVIGSSSVGAALRWFVDPYDPDGLYVLDNQGIKISLDGGQSWIFDTTMTNALTGGGKLKISASLLQDMQFSRGERQTRFALGTAGVICTMDFGITWFSALNSIALPGRPESAFFDPLSDPADRAVYVACEGRSILRVGGLPQLPPFEPSEPLDLMTLAALDH